MASHERHAVSDHLGWELWIMIVADALVPNRHQPMNIHLAESSVIKEDHSGACITLRNIHTVLQQLN